MCGSLIVFYTLFVLVLWNSILSAAFVDYMRICSSTDGAPSVCHPPAARHFPMPGAYIENKCCASLHNRVCRVCCISLLLCVEGMGAAASANVRGRLEYIAYLEAEVQMLRPKWESSVPILMK